jgi:hypothetical protein
MMYALLLVGALLAADAPAQGQEQQPVSAQQIDGAWHVVYLESAGQMLTPAQGNASVTIKNNTVSFQANDHKRSGTEAGRQAKQGGRQDPAADTQAAASATQQSWRLEFGPNQTVQATRVAGPVQDPASRQDREQRGEKRDATERRESATQQRTRSGVYILSREYLCVSLRGSGSHENASARKNGRTEDVAKENGRTEDVAKENGRTATAAGEARAAHQAAGSSSGSFILILRRGQDDRTLRSER